jgi:thioredoxin reductase (NADPH)
MQSVDFDLVIIGGGPAGLTAGLYAARARLNVLLIEKVAIGGQLLATEGIENYPGFPERTSGVELTLQMAEQVKRFDLNVEDNEVMALDLSEPLKKITLSDRTINTHAIVIASGASPKKLNVPGDDRFYGRGVSFCSTCDGPFYRDRVVAAVGGGDTAVQESLFLTKFAKKVYLIHRRNQFRAQKILQERAFDNDRIEIIWDSVLTGINGSTGVEKITVQNVKTGDTKELAVDACFIWIGIRPNTEFLGNTIKVDEFGFILADSNMATSVPGVFVAGDVRHTPLRQIATAIGDAAMAAYSAEHYLENINT